mmetsp:Transcript_79872/g.185457  ORF Transcript_79872/g.185457 Transcript_79872/m.185457 type:complete len:681 (-) Transcript_79872:192-2234(-)
MELVLDATCDAQIAEHLRGARVNLRLGNVQESVCLGTRRVVQLPLLLGGEALCHLDVLKLIGSREAVLVTEGTEEMELAIPCSEPGFGAVPMRVSLRRVTGAAAPRTSAAFPSLVLGNAAPEEADAQAAGSTGHATAQTALAATTELWPQLLPQLTAQARAIEELQRRCSAHTAALTQVNSRLSQIDRDQPLVFTAMQYNILADYLGNNMQPWLLYGANIASERRQQIMHRFYEKDEAGNYVHSGWPKYVSGILTEREIAAVEDYHETYFNWGRRLPKLLEEVASSNGDIVSLVELDHYEAFANALPEWDSCFRKRPRTSSRDGCGIFWRKTKFERVDSEGFDFVDRQAGTCTSKDRTCLILLLRFVASPSFQVIAISTHLARNPEDPRQTRVRACQASQLMKHLTDFTQRHRAQDAPVVLMGDFNANHFVEIRGIAQAVVQVFDNPCHHFLFRCVDVSTGPTSVTEIRNARIDVVVYDPQHLKVLEVTAPDVGKRIPDEEHPSDHIPVRVKFQVKAGHKRHKECANSWLQCVTGSERINPMTDVEIQYAFSFLDRHGEGKIDRYALEDSCLDIGFPLRSGQRKALLRCFSGRQINFSDFKKAYESQLNCARVRGIGDLEAAFRFFDAHGAGKIHAYEMRAVFAEVVPVEFDGVQIGRLLQQLEVDDDGYVDIRTFCSRI